MVNAAEMTEPAGPSETARAARVLVVEDDEIIGALLVDLLTDQGYAVRLAIDGRAGLTTLRAWRPNLILLDLMMPGVDGAAFRAEQRGDPALAAIPVVLLTARHGSADSGAALEAAAVVAKPFELAALLATVERCLAGQEGGREPGPATPR